LRRIISFLPASGWFILVTILLTLPGSAIPKEDWLDKIWFDKWVHIGLFAILALLFCWGIYKRKMFTENRKRSFVMCGLLCLAYGILMEFVQKYYIPNRSFDIGDMAADGVGSALGVLYSIKVYIKK
jgi:VanZ family protein